MENKLATGRGGIISTWHGIFPRVIYNQGRNIEWIFKIFLILLNKKHNKKYKFYRDTIRDQNVLFERYFLKSTYLVFHGKDNDMCVNGKYDRMDRNNMIDWIKWIEKGWNSTQNGRDR